MVVQFLKAANARQEYCLYSYILSTSMLAPSATSMALRLLGLSSAINLNTYWVEKELFSGNDPGKTDLRTLFSAADIYFFYEDVITISLFRPDGFSFKLVFEDVDICRVSVADGSFLFS